MFNGVDRIPACFRQMDRQTSCDGIVRAMHTRRAVKTDGRTCSDSYVVRAAAGGSQNADVDDQQPLKTGVQLCTIVLGTIVLQTPVSLTPSLY